MRAREPLPQNSWTLVGAEAVAAIGYWLGFLTSIGMAALRHLLRSLPGTHATRDDD